MIQIIGTAKAVRYTE